jgi:hypothetical protein
MFFKIVLDCRWFYMLLIGLLSWSTVVFSADCGRNQPQPPDPTIPPRFINNDDGTITDMKTELMWKQCAEGLSGSRCEQGSPLYLDWNAAVNLANNTQFAGHNDWRLPKRNELQELISPGCVMPALNLAWFPNTPTSWFWFQSPEADNSQRAGQLSFAYGSVFSGSKESRVHVRLVRDQAINNNPQ